MKIRSGAKSYGLAHLYWKENIILLRYNRLIYLSILYTLPKSKLSYAVLCKSKLGMNCLNGNFLSLDLDPAMLLIPSHLCNAFFFLNIIMLYKLLVGDSNYHLGKLLSPFLSVFLCVI